MSIGNFVGYEYQDVTAKRSMASLYSDGYENFGWSLESAEDIAGKINSVILRFKRDRKIRNKAELTRLQHGFDACISSITALEASKYTRASVIAFSVGILGTIFMAGSVFSITAGLILPCVLLAIPAFVGWGLPYFLYRGTVRKKAEEVTPLMEQKYDELYHLCEKASHLLDQTNSKKEG